MSSAWPLDNLPKRRAALEAKAKKEAIGVGGRIVSSIARAINSPRVCALVRDCVPPIMLRLSRRIPVLTERLESPELIWAKNRYDRYFDIDWSKTNFNRIAVINL